FQSTILIDDFTQCRNKIFRIIHKLFQMVNQFEMLTDNSGRTSSSNGFYTTYTSCYSRFRNNFEKPYLTRCFNMGTTAQFFRILIFESNYTNKITILLTK